MGFPSGASVTCFTDCLSPLIASASTICFSLKVSPSNLETFKLEEVFGPALNQHKEAAANYLQANKDAEDKASKHLKQRKEKIKKEAFLRRQNLDQQIARQADLERQREQEEVRRQERIKTPNQVRRKFSD